MVEMEHLDIRCVTLGVNLLDCADRSVEGVAEKVHAKLTRVARDLVPVCDAIQDELGVPIVNKRLAITPVAIVAAAAAREDSDLTPIARAVDRAARTVGVDFVGGFSAYVHKGITPADEALLASIPRALAETERVCASVSVASRQAGINVDAVARMGWVIKDAAEATADRGGLGCAKLVVFSNMPEDNPFMAGAVHGLGEPELVINVGVSGPGTVAAALKQLGPGADLLAVSDCIKRTAFKITRVGALVGREAAARLGVATGIVDLSLAPTPAVGDSVAEILEVMGVDACGGPGSTMALSLLTDAVKKGGAMASHAVGGLSGAFIPVSEDSLMDRRAAEGKLTLEKLEAMTSVCSVGLDMVVVPGDTPASTLSAIVGDLMAIGVINGKTTAVRIIPAPGKEVGDVVDFGGLLGTGTVMPVSTVSAERLIGRGGRVPAPTQALVN
ncbi:MAG: PFL family protein [Planctomycetota bacterium]|nr:MAG: PFL family protein [Planctomycetota bacterium]